MSESAYHAGYQVILLILLVNPVHGAKVVALPAKHTLLLSVHSLSQLFALSLHLYIQGEIYPIDCTGMSPYRVTAHTHCRLDAQPTLSRVHMQVQITSSSAISLCIHAVVYSSGHRLAHRKLILLS